MPIIENCPIFFAKLNPARPNAAYNKKNPTWELQVRTTSLEFKKYLETFNIRMKLMVYKEGTENEGDPILTEDGKKQWRVNLRKKSLKFVKGSKTNEMEPAKPVNVVDGNLDDVDPDTIGNGSIANIRVYQYEYEKEDGTKALASMLTDVQLVHHVLYAAKPHDPAESFGKTETTRVAAETQSMDEDDGDDHDDDAPATAAPPKMKTPSAPAKTADSHPEEAF